MYYILFPQSVKGEGERKLDTNSRDSQHAPSAQVYHLHCPFISCIERVSVLVAYLESSWGGQAINLEMAPVQGQLKCQMSGTPHERDRWTR